MKDAEPETDPMNSPDIWKDFRRGHILSRQILDAIADVERLVQLAIVNEETGEIAEHLAIARLAAQRWDASVKMMQLSPATLEAMAAKREQLSGRSLRRRKGVRSGEE